MTINDKQKNEKGYYHHRRCHRHRHRCLRRRFSRRIVGSLHLARKTFCELL